MLSLIVNSLNICLLTVLGLSQEIPEIERITLLGMYAPEADVDFHNEYRSLCQDPIDETFNLYLAYCQG